MEPRCGIAGGLLTCCLLLQASASSGAGRKLMVILLDGFRPDYVYRPGLTTEGFARILRDGSFAVGMTPDFPSSSYPNFYTLMTGLHAESHGMTGNFMYDVKTGKAFIIGSNPDSNLPMWWNKAEPLWVTAEAQGMPTYLYYWPGCDVRIRDRSPKFCKPYPGAAPTLEELDWAISEGTAKLENGNAHIVGIYVELADKIGHLQGMNSTAMQAGIVELDKRIAALLEKLREANLSDSVNLVLLSDHGMVVTTKEYYSVNVSEHVNDSDVWIEINEGTIVSYWPRPDAADRVYRALKKVLHVDVYLNNEVPERYYYKNGLFVPPITVVLQPPFVAVSNQRPWPTYGESKLPYVGFHGYDPMHSDMKGLFAAIGPAIRKGAVVDTMHAVDVYQLLCSLSGVSPEPHNGTWRIVEPVLAQVTSGHHSQLRTNQHILPLATVFLVAYYSASGCS